KLADILIVSTMDQSHYKHVMKALDVGYDILLEKPIAVTEEECHKIAEKAKNLDRKVAVCHVLRYTPFYKKLKELLDLNTIGKVRSITQTENVGYYHYAHSYVRGNWRRGDVTSPMVVAKCCHDFDIIKWLIGAECTAISSFGNLDYFKKENAPKGSADNCYKCRIDCPYNAIKFYEKNPDWFMIFSLDPDVRKVLSNPDHPYGKCVYKCDNNVVDNQVINMVFANNAVAQLNMTAFSNEMHRNLKIHGTIGEIEGDLEGMTIMVKIFGGKTETIDVRAMASDFSGHAGGDKRMILDFINNVRDKSGKIALTDISEALDSHKMAFRAEESRLLGGQLKTI
ncbi:MAG TPA: Gfo/Idh/MocA family oxidoreductase, partial [Bacilli bacterium]|nr:Gfo/Idh/MocA family oxidoreductase [Bacilli bacterium]